LAPVPKEKQFSSDKKTSNYYPPHGLTHIVIVSIMSYLFQYKLEMYQVLLFHCTKYLLTQRYVLSFSQCFWKLVHSQDNHVYFRTMNSNGNGIIYISLVVPRFSSSLKWWYIDISIHYQYNAGLVTMIHECMWYYFYIYIYIYLYICIIFIYMFATTST
jgi:hypothetical protein